MNSGDQRLSGIIKTWDDDKGYGFIVIPGRRKDVFFHISAVETIRRRPKQGDEVIYILEAGSEKKPRAEAVWLRGEPLPDETNLHRAIRTRHVWRLASLPAFVGGFAFLNVGFQIGLLFLGWTAIASAICFSLYGSDKAQAWRGRRRGPESVLVGWGIVGGWPGGLLAQIVFWHKTTKSSFQLAFWLTVLANGFVTAALAVLVRMATIPS